MDIKLILWLLKETELRLEITLVTCPGSRRRAAGGEKDEAAAARECAMGGWAGSLAEVGAFLARELPDEYGITYKLTIRS